MAAGGTTSLAVFALVANFAIATAKFAAAALTGSSAMLSSAIHSLVDMSSQALLLVGLRRARRPREAGRPGVSPPGGTSKEIYFWSFVVAVLLFSMGAGVAIYDGVHKITAPHPISNPQFNYMVLGGALLLSIVSTWIAVRTLNARGAGRSPSADLGSDKNAALYTVLVENLAAIAGLLTALAGIFVAEHYAIPEADGIASVAIGLILAFVAAFMAVELQGLLMEAPASAGSDRSGPAPADAGEVAALDADAAAVPGVEHAAASDRAHGSPTPQPAPLTTATTRPAAGMEPVTGSETASGQQAAQGRTAEGEAASAPTPAPARSTTSAEQASPRIAARPPSAKKRGKRKRR